MVGSNGTKCLKGRQACIVSVRVIAVLLGWLAAGGCTATIPNKFVKQAQPGVTLTALKASPDRYQGKVVILGGVIVDKKEDGGRIWLKVKNRPLDDDHIPHIPTSLDDPEAGHYWVVVNPQGLPQSYMNWARVTVVGQVTRKKAGASDQASAKEPVLTALYLRGWGSNWGGYGQREDTWEDNQAASYISADPKSPKQF
jgi:starvation-inducible outer membrane lipoprotein